MEDKQKTDSNLISGENTAKTNTTNQDQTTDNVIVSNSEDTEKAANVGAVESEDVVARPDSSQGKNKNRKVLYLVFAVLIVCICCLISLVISFFVGTSLTQERVQDRIDLEQDLNEPLDSRFPPTGTPNNEGLNRGNSNTGGTSLAFKNYDCTQFQASFSIPEDWFTYEDVSINGPVCYGSVENISTDFFFTTGLTISELSEVSVNYGLSPEEFARRALQNFSEIESVSEIKILELTNIGGLPATAAEISTTARTKQYTAFVYDNSQDIVYSIVLETTESSFDSFYQETGKTILDSLEFE